MANSAFNHEPSFIIPGSTTDNAVIRWDGTSGAGQLNSGILIDDSNVLSGITSLTVDNLNINGNTIISTDTNGNITFAPNGSGSVVADTVGNSEMSFNGTVLDLKNNGTQSSIKLYCETGNAHYQEIRGGPHSGATSYTMVLPHVPPTANQVLTTASISSNVAVLDWADASGTTINNNADNRIITGSGSAGTLEGESTVTYNAGTFTIANAATAQSLDVTTTGTAVTARIQLTSGATGTDGGTSLHFIEGSGNGAANNQQYFMGYRPGDNLFRFYSNSAQGVGSGGGNIFTIADGGTTVGFTGSIAQGAGARAHSQYGAIACLVSKSGNQSIPDTTETAVTWNVSGEVGTDDGTASGGTGTMHSHTSNNDKIYARTAGYYLCGASIPLSTAYARMVLNRNGSWKSISRYGSGDVRFTGNFVDLFAVGDYFQVEMSQWNGSQTIYGNNSKAWMIRIA